MPENIFHSKSLSKDMINQHLKFEMLTKLSVHTLLPSNLLH